MKSLCNKAIASYKQRKKDKLIANIDKLISESKLDGEPYRVCRRLNILRDYSDEKTKLYPRN